MITLRKYKPDDWVMIDDAVEPFMFLEPLEDFNRVIQRGIAVTAIEDGVVMSCGGVSYVNEDEGIAWLKMSKKCLKQTYRWGRTIKETFKLMTEALGNMKIVTYILKDFCKGAKVARLIGMTKSDKTYKFNNNIYNRYVMVI